MEGIKEKLLEETYRLFMEAGFSKISPDILDHISDDSIMGFGTTLDEKIFHISGLKELLKRQNKQSEGMSLQWDIKPVHRHISADENTAIYADDLLLHITAGYEKVEMYLRFSIVLEYKNEKWFVVHWHGSKPENVESEKDTWGIENWKQKAEALEKEVAERTADLVEKNRELEIEAALERVRAASMAMNQSDELKEAAAVLYKELRLLNIGDLFNCGYVFVDKKNNLQHAWMTHADGSIRDEHTMPLTGDNVLNERYDNWKKKVKLFSRKVGGKELRKHETFVSSQNSRVPHKNKSLSQLPDPIIFYCGNFSAGYLHILSKEELSKESESILSRFTKVFEQAYTRFLDLQKAEAQAREAQIEAALERVRAQTMAMHNSEDVGKCVVKMFGELTALGVDEGTRFGIGILNHDNENIQLWTAKKDGDEVKMHIGNLDMTSHPLLMSARKAWKEQVPLHKYVLEGEDLQKYYQMLNAAPDYKIQIPIEKLPEKEIQHCFIFEHGFFYAFTSHEFQSDLIQITKRFTSVFAQTYRRYLDLQKAEAQAREAQIEAALERVRSKTMAMHKSEQLPETAQVLFEQFAELGKIPDRISIGIIKEELQVIEWWATDQMGSQLASHFNATILQPTIAEFFSTWKEGKDSTIVDISGEALKEWIAYVRDEVKMPIDDSKIKGRRVHHAAFFSQGLLLISAHEPMPKETMQLLVRFAKVFSQTYTRFLDLQKAEAQAREAQIEASLERLRSKTMAMHSSRDVGESVATLFDELSSMKLLGSADRCGIGIMQPHEIMELWTAEKSEGGKTELTIGFLDMKPHPLLRAAYNGWVEKKEVYQYILEGEDKLNYYQVMQNQTQYKIKKDYYSGSEKIVHTDFYFDEGVLYVFSLNEFTRESAVVFSRFANVFGQTYRRYLDLKKAEAQAREAQIEAALEKVRSRAMAMQKSDELLQVIKTLSEQLRHLGLHAEAVSFLTDGDERGYNMWLSSPGEDFLSKIYVPRIQDRTTLLFQEAKETGKRYYSYVLSKEQKDIYFQNFFDNTVLRDYPDTGKEQVFAAPGMTSTNVLLDSIVLSVSNFNTIPFSDQENEIINRIAFVFQQTYTRFLDLQKAEAQAKEAVKQSSLDRVRGEIASMRTTADLDRITPLIWKELTTLGISFIRCGVFIMDEHQNKVHTYLSTPDGHAIAAFHTPMDDSGGLAGAIDHWRQQKVFVTHWVDSDFQMQADVLLKQGSIATREQYLSTLPKEGFHLHFLPFRQGMLYVGCNEQLSGDSLQLVQALADAFSVAYARYEDFTKLELAKRQIENTLSELKATQSQLIQSEKMASLGELTAGIAHEIQNPLNFVNNFSEVSNELIREIQDIRRKSQDCSSSTEEEELLNDIASNLEKISHHGKRAADIVKGMLQHSRSSSGAKEPTDINALADEYLRLAYHGLRAKDKSFNATMKTDFDEKIGNINIIPQDIGRVILNLITNAFYAVNERANNQQRTTNKDSYEPTVIVSTKKLSDKIEIRVEDNGSGIPDSIKEKIFQPFFTTKPTGQGTGLGLSLSYDIMKAHGGELKVETKNGEGSTFTIQLLA